LVRSNSKNYDASTIMSVVVSMSQTYSFSFKLGCGISLIRLMGPIEHS